LCDGTFLIHIPAKPMKKFQLEKKTGTNHTGKKKKKRGAVFPVIFSRKNLALEYFFRLEKRALFFRKRNTFPENGKWQSTLVFS
jgi:hypothetical protein